MRSTWNESENEHKTQTNKLGVKGARSNWSKQNWNEDLCMCVCVMRTDAIQKNKKKTERHQT